MALEPPERSQHQRADQGLIETSASGRERAGVAFEDPPHASDATRIAAPLRDRVKPEDLVHERGEDGVGQGAPRRHTIEQRRLIEAVHRDDPLDRIAALAEPQVAAGDSADGQHTAVDRRRRPAG